MPNVYDPLPPQTRLPATGGEPVEMSHLPQKMRQGPIGSFKKGGKVKKTGLALVHEGEVIVPKDRAAHAMGGGKKSSKKSSKKSKKSKVHKMHIRRTANGGFLAEHHSMPDEAGQTAPMEEHSLPDIESLQSHVGEHMGPQQEEQEPQAAPQAGAVA